MKRIDKNVKIMDFDLDLSAPAKVIQGQYMKFFESFQEGVYYARMGSSYII